MRTTAEVLPHGLPRGGINVVVNGQLIAANFNAFVVIPGVSALETDQFQLVVLRIVL